MTNDTKQKLIQMTRHMIDRQGVDAVSMRELGKEMNLSRTAMYRHFKNKEDLLAAIVAENFETLTGTIRSIMESVHDPRELLSGILHAYFDFGVHNPEHYRLMSRTQWDKELYPDLHRAAYGVFQLVEECLEKAENIRKPPKEATAIMYAFIHGLVELNSERHDESEKGLDDPSRLIDSFLDLILK